jgi:hypothetical protein
MKDSCQANGLLSITGRGEILEYSKCILPQQRSMDACCRSRVVVLENKQISLSKGVGTPADVDVQSCSKISKCISLCNSSPIHLSRLPPTLVRSAASYP